MLVCWYVRCVEMLAVCVLRPNWCTSAAWSRVPASAPLAVSCSGAGTCALDTDRSLPLLTSSTAVHFLIFLILIHHSGVSSFKTPDK